MGANTNLWTADEDTFLRTAWPTDSARIIAQSMHRSRNAIIGRATRLKLTKPTDKFHKMPRKRNRKRRAPANYNPRAPRPAMPLPPAGLPAGVAAFKPLPGSEPILLADWYAADTGGLCRWPIGTFETVEAFCGCPRVDDKAPYCLTHTHVARQPRR